MSWKQLPSNLRKLRHIQTIAIRHLELQDDTKQTPIDCYLSVLQVPENTASPKSKAPGPVPTDGEQIYKSMVLKSTLNPTWDNIDWNDLSIKTQKFIFQVVKVAPDGIEKTVLSVYVDLQDIKRLPTEHLSNLKLTPSNSWFILVKGGIYTSSDLDKLIRPNIPNEMVPAEEQKKQTYKMRLSDVIRSVSASGKIILAQKKIEKESEAICTTISSHLSSFQKTDPKRKYEFIEEEINKEKRKLEEDLDKLKEVRDSLPARVDRMKTMAETYSGLLVESKTYTEKLAKEKADCVEASRRLSRRQKVMIYKLKKIYPIVQSPHDDNLITISGLDVKNNEDDESFSSGLGYACHLIVMLAKYLDIPLGRYHLLYQSSRSFLVDMVPVPTNYALFLRGVEKQRSEYAILLLNNCIKQLCVRRGINGAKIAHNPSQVLRNLKLLLDNESPQYEISKR